MIAACILIQAEPGEAALVAAAHRDLPGVSKAASLAGPYGVTARAQGRNIDELPGRSALRKPVAVDHHANIHEVGEGGAQAVCSCGWRSPVFGTDKTAGTMDPLQRAADAGDLHEWEMSLR